MVRPTRRLSVLAGIVFVACHEPVQGPLAVSLPLPTPNAAAASSPLRVLLLVDVDIPGTDALAAALSGAGYQVTRRPAPEFTWDGTNPSLAAFDAVVHLDGQAYFAALPLSGQTALVNFVNAGGRYVTEMYTQYEVRTTLTEPLMEDLALNRWGGGAQSDNCLNCTITYTADPVRLNHPVLAGLPASFSFRADGHDAGPLVVFPTRPATILMRAQSGGPGVIARHVGLGCVVNFSMAPNQAQTVGFTLQDPNIQRLYINAVGWDCATDSDPPVIQLVVNPTLLRPANHKMVLVAKGISALDQVDPVPQFTVAVTVNEPAVAPGAPKADPDWQIVTNPNGTFDVLVRAERLAGGTGRIYTITATATDANGNTATRTGTVTVPKN